MADSAQDPKVEDVLSSVRRLVSQEIPKRQPSKPVASDGALVLTSKDRIKADHTARVTARSLEQRIAELEAAVDSGADEFEPDGSEDQAQHRPDRIVYTRPRPSETEERQARSSLRLSEIAVIETDQAKDTDGVSDAPLEFRRGAPSQLSPEAPMAEDVPTLPASTAEVRAFSDPDDVVARIEARIERGGEPLEERPSVLADVPHEDDFDTELMAAVQASLAPQADETDEADAGDTLRLEDMIAPRQPEVTVEVAKTEETPEDREDDVPGPAPEFPQEHVSEDAAPVGDLDPLHSEPTQVEAAAAALGALPDEDAMRLLVARLLREELQGDLGERITRNVRKLVRSEIMRVLESRKLD